MKENDKIENNVAPPEQKSGADSLAQPNNCPRAGANGSTDGLIQQSTNPPTRLARPPRAKYRHRNHRRTGKVARLPAAIRHEICLMFTRYKEYRDIIAWLASQGHPGISESNLSRWRKGGFQDWLRREQDKRLDLITIALEVLEELVTAEKNVQPAADQSQLFGVPPSGGTASSNDNGLSRRSETKADLSTVAVAKVEPLTPHGRVFASSHSSNHPTIHSSDSRKPSP